MRRDFAAWRAKVRRRVKCDVCLAVSFKNAAARSVKELNQLKTEKATEANRNNAGKVVFVRRLRNAERDRCFEVDTMHRKKQCLGVDVTSLASLARELWQRTWGKAEHQPQRG